MPKSILPRAILCLAALFATAAGASPTEVPSPTAPVRIAPSCQGDECTQRYGERRVNVVEQRRQAKRFHRYFAKKQLCRQYDVRFDRSGLCW